MKISLQLIFITFALDEKVNFKSAHQLERFCNRY